MVATYDIGEVKNFVRMQRGFVNHNYKLTTSKGYYLLKIYLKKTLESILYELNVLDKLVEIDFPIARAIEDVNGERIIYLNTVFAVIYEFIEGEEPSLTCDNIEEVAPFIARLNLIEDRGNIARKNLLSMPFFHELIAKFPTAEHQYPAIFKHFEKEVAALGKPLSVDLPSGFIHRDVFPDNTIFEEGKLKAMIDFEFACVDRFMVEIGAAINGFCYPNNRLDRELVDCLINSYQKVRKLTEQELELIDDYIRLGALSNMSWHLNEIIQEPDPHKLARIGELVARGKELDG